MAMHLMCVWGVLQQVWKQQGIRRGSMKIMFVDLLGNVFFLFSALLQRFLIDTVLDPVKSPYEQPTRVSLLLMCAAVPVVLGEIMNMGTYRKIFTYCTACTCCTYCTSRPVQTVHAVLYTVPPNSRPHYI